jgi:glycerophosphoryl diester phosphodiesterase
MRVIRVAHRSVRLTVGAVALTVIILCSGILAVFVFLDHWGEEYTSGRIPVQFYAALTGEKLEDYRRVFGVAHNSGDTVEATREALDHGADVIEIDVVSLDGKLYAAHSSPLRYIGRRVFRGPTLADVWEAAREADVIKLDLKESSPAYLELLLAFLAEHEDHEVVIATGNVRALQTFEARYPRAIRVLSVPNERRLRALQRDEGLIALIDGVTIRHRLVSEESAAWLKARGLLILAWTVNDLSRVNELVNYGADGITTDNLAIMELLGGQQRGEATLGRGRTERR